MIVLTLHRDSPLSRAEIEALPSGCYPVMSSNDIIARAELELPPAHMVRFAVEMVRAIPDAALEAQEQPSAAGGAILRAGALTDPFRTWMPSLFRERLPSAAALSSMAVTPSIDPDAARRAAPQPPASTPTAPLAATPPAAPEPLPAERPARAPAASALPPELSSFMDALLASSVVETGGMASQPPSPGQQPPPPMAPPPGGALPPVVPLPAMTPPATTPPATTPPATTPPVVPPSAGVDPWALLERGELEAARTAFASHTLDTAEQHRVRDLLISSTPADIVRGCWISRLTKWTASAPLLNRVLFSADASVRAEAVRSLGTLAGASAEPSLHMLLRDPDPEVQRAARKAIFQIQRRNL